MTWDKRPAPTAAQAEFQPSWDGPVRFRRR
jgi:hypothetical protein